MFKIQKVLNHDLYERGHYSLILGKIFEYKINKVLRYSLSLVCSKKSCSASISAVFATDQIKTVKIGNVFKFADETSASQIECVSNFRYDSMKNHILSFKTSSYVIGYHRLDFEILGFSFDFKFISSTFRSTV